MTSHFCRGKSKVYYNSDVWDPGSGVSEFTPRRSESEEDLARTSFRSNREDPSGPENSMNSDGSRYVK